MNKKEQFNGYLRAGYPCLWIQTSEETRAIKTLYHSSGDCLCYKWDVAGGLVDLVNGSSKPLPSPVGAVQSLISLPENSVLFLPDFHAYIKSPEVQRVIKNSCAGMKATGRHLVVISSVLGIPQELEKVFTVLDFDLPTIEELKAMAVKLCEDTLGAGCFPSEYYDVMGNARGLTLEEAENAVSRSLVSSKSIDGAMLEAEKLQAVKKTGLCTLYPAVSQNELRGLEGLKSYWKTRAEKRGLPGMPLLKGILLFGAPGTGKSLAAKTAGDLLGWPILSADGSTFKGSLVGESEKKTKDFWRLVRGVSPCVVWLDECEKIFAGVQSSGKTDGGAGSASYGIFLNEMEETIKAGYSVYVVATCNDIDELLAASQGAIMRRFDAVFYCDLPSEDERRDIINFMAGKYGLTDYSVDSLVAMSDGWSGAEIEKCVTDALYDGVKVASENIRPVYLQNKAKIDSAREWAKINARPANKTLQNFFDVKSFKRALDLGGER